MTTRGLLDTSVFVAQETSRALDADRLPDQGYVSVITLAELRAGVLVAADTESRSQRLRTLEVTAALAPLPVDPVAAGHWARLRVRLHEGGRRLNVNDLWIASIALAHDLPVISQDADFDALAELGLLEVIRV
jgi:predicted nucleic acid-binding protein